MYVTSKLKILFPFKISWESRIIANSVNTTFIKLYLYLITTIIFKHTLNWDQIRITGYMRNNVCIIILTELLLYFCNTDST